MGKSAKAKKEKKADFSKVKLKVGKKLPKGQNLTDTSFKSKKIIISSQLKQTEGEPLTRRKLSLKELLSHLRHHSVYVRQDGLNGVRELLTSHGELAQSALGQVLSPLATLLLDDDPKLRKNAVSVISDVVAQVTEDQLAPFFPALVTHLTCAMTHIRPSVQQTSLPLLAALLGRFPRLVSSAVDQVLPTLLEQISRCGACGAGRALLADPATQLSTTGWRVTVLRQLAQVLAAQPELEDRCVRAPPTVPAAAYCPLYRRPAEPGVQVTAAAGLERHLLTEPTELQRYTATVMPLLFDTYREVAPAADTDGSLLSDEAAETLAVVLQVIAELLRHLKHLDDTKHTTLVRWFTDTHRLDLHRHVLAPFPYSRLVGRRSTTASDSSGAADIGSDLINVLACELAAGLATPAGTDVAAPAARTDVLQYLTDYLSSDRCSELARVCRVLRRLLRRHVAVGAGAGAGAGATSDLDVEGRRRQLVCVRAAAERHGRVRCAEQATALTQLLTDVVWQADVADVAGSDAVADWAAQLLPSVRFCTSDLDLLVLLRRIAVMGCGQFIGALKREAVNLLGSAAAAANHVSAVPWQRAIIELLFWQTDVSADAQAAFQQLLAAEHVGEAVKVYALEVLGDKYVPVSVDVVG